MQHIIDTLQQGDIIGSYSVFQNDKLYFEAIAASTVRILSLDDQFFTHMVEDDIIHGLCDSLDVARENVAEFGVPYIDYRTN